MISKKGNNSDKIKKTRKKTNSHTFTRKQKKSTTDFSELELNSEIETRTRTRSKSKSKSSISENSDNLQFIEEEIYDNKKIHQYKDYLKNLTEKSEDLLKSNNYQDVVDNLNRELKKSNDKYLTNEILKISENIKFKYYNQSKNINDDLNYPTYYDPNFSQKIFKKAEFYQNKLNKIKPEDVDKIVEERKSDIISLAQHQRFLKNFMANSTPYRGVLIFHGLGVGKTCASIAIAETLRPHITDNNQKIIIISKSHFDRSTIFNIERLKKGINQCAGDTFINDLNNPQLVSKCQSGNAEACKIIKYKVDKLVKNTYNFFGSLEWAKHVIRDLQKTIRGVPEHKQQEVEAARIKKLYSNTVMIIDEVHNIKDKEAGENKSKFVPPVLMKVLKYAENLRLVLLTGTPMFNEPADLISILNYLLINDKRPILRESDIFKSDGSFTKDGKEMLINYSRGYVSFMRSENPYNYPIRFSSSINNSYDIIKPDSYPTKDIFGHPIKVEHNVIKQLEIIGCPMSRQQEKVYQLALEKRLTPEEEKISAAYSLELQTLNFIYQDFEQTDNLSETYGDKGLYSIMSKIGNKSQYQFNDPDTALEFKGDNMKKHSSKIHKIMENIEQTNGLVFIYTEYEASGILPMAFALELAGYKKYKSSDSPVLISEHKEKKYKGDYLIISGNANLSKYADTFIAKEHDMVNEPVKVILATRAASEGISLFGVREIHILNPWHNLNRISQAIGRGLRSWSHIRLPKEERNITVYIYAATFGPRSVDKDRETIDLKIYREAESKAIHIGEAEEVLRRNAIDCPLNKDGNEYTEKDWGEKITVLTSRGEKKNVSVFDKPYSHVCHYQKDCDFKCYNSPPKMTLKQNELDYSTYDFDSLKYEIQELEKIIAKLFKNDIILTLENILTKIPSKFSKDSKLVYKALDKMLNDKFEVLDKYNRPGYLIYRGNYYIYQPKQINNEDLFVYQRGVPPPIRPNMIDLTEYIVKIDDEKKKLLKKEQSNIFDIMDYIETQYQYIINKTPNDLFYTTFNLSPVEVYEIIVDRLTTSFKKVLLNYLLTKYIKEEPLGDQEKILIKCLEQNIIRVGYLEHTKNKDIFGYRLVENEQQTFYKYIYDSENFVQDTGIQLQIVDLQKIENSRNNEQPNKIYGYLKFDKMDLPPMFKIKDVSKGDKKAIKGITCIYKSRKEIYDHLKQISPNTKDAKDININNKKIMCDDIEILLRRNDKARKDGKRWFYSVEEAKEKEELWS